MDPPSGKMPPRDRTFDEFFSVDEAARLYLGETWRL